MHKFPGSFATPVVTTATVLCLRVGRGIIGMKRAETALLSALAARFNASHWKLLLPLTYD